MAAYQERRNEKKNILLASIDKAVGAHIQEREG